MEIVCLIVFLAMVISWAFLPGSTGVSSSHVASSVSVTESSLTEAVAA